MTKICGSYNQNESFFKEDMNMSVIVLWSFENQNTNQASRNVTSITFWYERQRCSGSPK